VTEGRGGGEVLEGEGDFEPDAGEVGCEVKSFMLANCTPNPKLVALLLD